MEGKIHQVSQDSEEAGENLSLPDEDYRGEELLDEAPAKDEDDGAKAAAHGEDE